jgi:hypothetical protein
MRSMPDLSRPRGSRVVAALVAAIVGVSFTQSANASIERTPSVDSVCLNKRVVFRPRDGRSLDTVGPEERVELVRVTICEESRRACMEEGQEVPMFLCR